MLLLNNTTPSCHYFPQSIFSHCKCLNAVTLDHFNSDKSKLFKKTTKRKNKLQTRFLNENVGNYEI